MRSLSALCTYVCVAVGDIAGSYGYGRGRDEKSTSSLFVHQAVMHVLVGRNITSQAGVLRHHLDHTTRFSTYTALQ